MAIGNYGQLKSAVANWLHRADLTSVIPDFVALAESNIRRDVRVRAMEDSTAVTLTSTRLAVPDRLAGIRSVLLDDVPQRYMLPEQFHPIREDRSERYTIEGDEFVFQSSSGDVSIDYIAWFAALSDDGDTNWLLTNHPDVYLFGALVEGSSYIKDDPSIWQAKYLGALTKLRTAETNTFGPLTVRPDIRVC